MNKPISKMLLLMILQARWDLDVQQLPEDEALDGRAFGVTEEEFKQMVINAEANPPSKTIIASFMDQDSLEELTIAQWIKLFDFKHYFLAKENEPAGVVYILMGTNEEITTEPENDFETAGLISNEIIYLTRDEALNLFDKCMLSQNDMDSFFNELL